MFNTNRERNNTIYWILGLLLLSILLLLWLARYLSASFKPIAKVQLSELVTEATQGLYHIQYSDLHLNVLTGMASLSDVQIIPDTAVYRKLVGKALAPNNLYTIKLKTLAIRHFHPLRYLRYKKLNIDQILFENPDVTMVNKQLDFNETNRPVTGKTPYNYISRYLKEFRVKQIDLKNIRFKYVNNNLPVPQTDSVSRLNISLEDWLIDSAAASDSRRLHYLKDIRLNLHDYTYATPDSMYHIRLEQLGFQGSTGRLSVSRFSVAPRYSEMEFGKVAGYARDRYHIEMNDINLNGIDLPLYIRRQELYAKEMNIANGGVEVFNNNSLEKKTEPKTGKYPHQLLQQLPAQLSVRKLNISNVDLSYSEYDQTSRQKGRITFEKTSGTLTNITNASRIKAKDRYLLADFNTLLMGQGALHVKFKFDLAARDGAFEYSGRLGAIDGRALNRITRPLGMVHIKHADIKSLDFDIRANDHLATGSMDFAYENLAVALLKREEGQERLVRQGLLSILANAMVINPSNPNEEGVFITAPIRHERKPERSFFNFIWRSLFQGIKYSIGVTPEKEREVKAKIARFEKIKTDRDKRRAAKGQR
ncbi:hypothetical protein [Pedobacter sp. JY14-1]|uniref:hypothetical protein n=1 Tax=Pedobacter sp. JY14-1 TaxID=3034151 RepID=UPI0023E2A4DA|nr:hypothetical protein [Pedobacter sp. JY14-1]